MSLKITNLITPRCISYYYFTIANSLFAVIVASFYFFSKSLSNNLPEYSIGKYINAITYNLANHFSIIVLCFAIINLIALPTILIKGKLRLIIQAVFASALLSLLMLDTYIFYSEGIHLTDLFFTKLSHLFTNDISLLLKWPYIKNIVLFWCLLSILEYQLVKKLEYTAWLQNNNIGKKFITFFATLLIATQLIYFFSKSNSCVFELSRHLPFQYRNNLFLDKIYPELTENTNLKDINYPLQPLITTEVTAPKNILIIAVDAWRADCFNEQDSPNLWQLAQTGTIFNNHISTANHTRHGLFGLFYGIPSTHWYSFFTHQQSPVVIDRLQQLNYELGIFISTQVKEDKLDKTIFSNVSNLRMHSAGATPSEWDENTTKDWLNWYNNLDKSKPWFSFVFYFAAHDHDFPTDYTNKYQPTAGKIRYADLAKMQGKSGMVESYKISVHYIDSLTKKIITALKTNNQLQDTLIIITSDHGHELNDNLQNQWGHSTNFTEYQLKVPFAITGPKFNSNSIIGKRTTHYDVIPTIMTNFLGVSNDSIDYTIGNDLLKNNKTNNYSIAATTRWGSIFNSVITFGFVDDNYQAIKLFPSGKYKLFNKYNRNMLNNINHKEKNILDIIQYMTKYLK